MICQGSTTRWSSGNTSNAATITESKCSFRARNVKLDPVL
jgi:hypothetical protein